MVRSVPFYIFSSAFLFHFLSFFFPGSLLILGAHFVGVCFCVAFLGRSRGWSAARSVASEGVRTSRDVDATPTGKMRSAICTCANVKPSARMPTARLS